MKQSLAAALIGASLLASTGVASAAYQTFFGEDLNNTPLTPLASTPNSLAKDQAFRALLTGAGTETFETQPLGPPPGGSLALSFPGFGGSIAATLSGGDGQVASVVPGTTNGFGRYSIPSATSSRYWQVDAGRTTGNFEVTFSQAIAAFGFYGVDIGDFGGQLVLDLLRQDSSVMTSLLVPNSDGGDEGETDGSVIHFGILAGVAAEDFWGVRFRTTSGAITDVFAFDNFTIAEREQVEPPPPGELPEPASLALLGLALAGAGLARRRK